MKKVLTSIGLASLLSLSTTSVMAGDAFAVTPLIGFDLGYANLNVDDSASKVDGSNDGGFVGMKIGARNEHYRIYLDAKGYVVPDFDYMNSFGAQIQYILQMNDAKTWEFYFGANGGLMSMQYEKRTIQNPYLGGDVGIGYALNDFVSFEFGVKYLSLNISHDNGFSTSTIPSMLNVVGGLTFSLEPEKPLTRR